MAIIYHYQVITYYQMRSQTRLQTVFLPRGYAKPTERKVLSIKYHVHLITLEAACV